MDERKLIYADDAIEAIEEITWYHQNINNEMVRGANSSEDQAWYKAEDVYEALEQLPSVQPEHLVKKTGNLVNGLVNDCISRQAAIDAVHKEFDECLVWDESGKHTADEVERVLTDLPSAQPRWIPFETREPDAEEKQEHPEWDFVLCGKLPQDGQRILVNIKYKGHEAVQMDEYNDDGRECYLYSGYDIATEATAWMPLPEPYEEEQDD